MTLPDTVRPASRVGNVTLMVAGAGTPGSLGIIKALRQTPEFEARLVAVDTDADASGFSLVDTAATVSAGDEFVADVMEVARREAVDVILPLGTTDLHALAEAKPRFENEGIEVMVSDPHVLSNVTDKGRLYDQLVQHGHFVTPEFYRVSTCEEFVDALHALGYPEQRVCFKRPVSTEKRSLRTLDPETDRFDVLLHQKPNSTVTTLEDVLPVLEESVEFPDLVVMEYLPGEEFSVDVLARENDVPVTISRSHGESDEDHSCSSTVEEVPNLIDIAEDICSFLDVEYNVNVRFRYAADGTPQLVEVHPYISDSITACVGAGVNFPALSVQYALGRDLPDVSVDWGTHVTRDWQEVVYRPDKDPTTI